VVMWRTKSEQFLPAILCPNVRTASFVAAAFRGLAVCPNCLRLFDPYAERIDGSKGDKYCTAACGSRYRQRLYRRRVVLKKLRVRKSPRTKSSKGRARFRQQRRQGRTSKKGEKK